MVVFAWVYIFTCKYSRAILLLSLLSILVTPMTQFISPCTPDTHRVGSNRKRHQQSTNAAQKSIKTVFSIAICRQYGEKWQSKTLFLTIFDLRSSIVLAISIAAYPVWDRKCHSFLLILPRCSDPGEVIDMLKRRHRLTCVCSRSAYSKTS